jgi:hypothetical protein
MNRFVGMKQFVRLLVRPLAMATIWLTAIAFFGTAYFLSGRRVRVEEAVIFTVAFGNASAVSAVIAMTVGACRRWAVEAALPMAILVAAPVGIAGALSWLAPTLSGNLPRVDYFPNYRGHIPTAVLGIARQTFPTGAILGASVGAILGLSTFLARDRPRLFRWVILGLLLCCVVGSTHIMAFDRIVDFVVKTRMDGATSLMVAWTIGSELASAIGACAGALVGAVIASAAMRLGDGGRASRESCVNSRSEP